MSQCILLCFWPTSTFTTYAQLGSLLRIALTILVLYNGSAMAVGQLWQLALTILVLYNDCSVVMIAHNAWHAHAYTHKTRTHAGTNTQTHTRTVEPLIQSVCVYPRYNVQFQKSQLSFTSILKQPLNTRHPVTLYMTQVYANNTIDLYLVDTSRPSHVHHRC